MIVYTRVQGMPCSTPSSFSLDASNCSISLCTSCVCEITSPLAAGSGMTDAGPPRVFQLCGATVCWIRSLML